MKETLAIIAAILVIIGHVPYLRDMIKKKIQPHPYTWLVWTIVALITFFGQVSKGAGIGALPTAVAELFTIIIFIFSIRYGFKDISKVDTYFLIIALLAIIPWIITNDATLSVIIAVSIDVIAYIPTIRKTWRFPRTETPWLYNVNIIRHGLTLFSLQTYNIATTIHSIAMVGTNSLMRIILWKKKSVS
ncbi:MAG: hypothetical protein RJB39_728 [Candidatus Parcubacteria bacterium]|jgi:hypothetical protein